MKRLFVIILSTFFLFSLPAEDGFSRKECQWESRNLRTMVFRLKNVSWSIERHCRKSSSKGKKTCAGYITYATELLEEINGQYKVAKDRCIK